MNDSGIMNIWILGLATCKLIGIGIAIGIAIGILNISIY
jgi:hypothetical protein